MTSYNLKSLNLSISPTCFIKFSLLRLSTYFIQLPTNDYREVMVEIPWSDSTQKDMLAEMSAVCFLFARNIQDMMKKEGITPPPMGRCHPKCQLLFTAFVQV